MIFQFPSKPSDWIDVWRKTRTITLSSFSGFKMTIPIEKIEPAQFDRYKQPRAARVQIDGGSLMIGFTEYARAINEPLTYIFTGLDPKQGRWQIPKRLIDALDNKQGDDP